MSDTQILKRYTVVTLITLAAVMAITYVLEVFVGVDAGAGMGVVSVALPALDAGGNYARLTGVALHKGRMWALAFYGALINFAVGILILSAVSLAFGQNLAVALLQVGWVVLVAVLLIVGVIYVLMGRFFIGFGMRQDLKRQQKQTR